MAMDCSMEEDDPKIIQKFCIRFKTAEIAKDFETAFEAAKTTDVAPAAPAAADEPEKPEPQISHPEITNTVITTTPATSAPKPNLAPKSSLAAIFTKKPEDVVPVKEEPKSEAEPKVNLFGGLASAMKSSGFGQPAGSSTFNFSFKSAEPAKTAEPAKPAAPFQFGQKPAADAAKPAGGFSFPTNTESPSKTGGFSFGGAGGGFKGLQATGTNVGFGSINTDKNVFSTNSGFNFAGQGKALFTEPNESQVEPDADGDADTTGAGDPHFEPIIPMPDLVKVKTGEEGLEEVFKYRAKLYRWAETEWKERGIGDCKIYKEPNTGRGRILLRREQVHKILFSEF